MGLAVAVGVVTAALLGAGPWLAPHLFTRDAQLWPLMRSVAPQARYAHATASSIVGSPGLCAVPLPKGEGGAVHAVSRRFPTKCECLRSVQMHLPCACVKLGDKWCKSKERGCRRRSR